MLHHFAAADKDQVRKKRLRLSCKNHSYSDFEGSRGRGDKISCNCIPVRFFAGVGRAARRPAQMDVILLFTPASEFSVACISFSFLIFCYYIIIRSVPLRRGKVRAHHDNRKACAARFVPLLPPPGRRRTGAAALSSFLSRPRANTPCHTAAQSRPGPRVCSAVERSRQALGPLPWGKTRGKGRGADSGLDFDPGKLTQELVW